MKKTIIATTMLLASISQADIIKCVFTEPFVNTTYSTSQSSLTYDSAGAGKKVIKNVSLQIKGAGLIDLVSKDGKVLQSLSITGKGSDGMSDRIFPYEVKDNSMVTGANGGIGGCESNYLKAKEGQN